MRSLVATAALVASTASVSAAVAEYIAHQIIDITSPSIPQCSAGMLVNLPPTWRSGDGAVVLLAVNHPHDAEREKLVSALLADDAAVLELVPLDCGGRHGGPDGVIAGALGALDAVSRDLGAGLVVAIGYGRRSAALSDVVREPVASVLGTNGPRYAAAVVLGDGPTAFALGAPLPAREQAPSRLAALCRTIASVTVTLPQVAASATTAEACSTALAGDAPHHTPSHSVAHRQ
jgi:hypothetical protein